MILVKEKKHYERAGTSLVSGQYHIADEALPIVMDVLSTQYSDPQGAVMREYITNAVDEHTASGRLDVPIRIKPPTALDPVFSVRDYGRGLSRNDTCKYLFGYGSSAKTDTDRLIGGFGNGCKSGYAVADSFTYTVWHGGRKRVWVSSKDAFDNGSYDCMLDEPSDEPSGIMVEVPYPDMQYGADTVVAHKLDTILMFLPGIFEIVQSDGSVQSPIRPEPRISHTVDLALHGDDKPKTTVTFARYDPDDLPLRGPLLVYGGTSYSIDLSEVDDALSLLGGPDAPPQGVISRLRSGVTVRTANATATDRGLTIHVPVGSVQPDASRDSLRYSKYTRHALAKIFAYLLSDRGTKDYHDSVLKYVTDPDSTIVSRRILMDTAGMFAPEPHSEYEGLTVPRDIAAVTYTAYSLSGIRTGSLQLYPQKLAESGYLVAVNQSDANIGVPIAVLELDELPPRGPARNALAWRAIAYMKEQIEAGRGLDRNSRAGVDQRVNLAIAVMVDGDARSIPWVADGGVYCFKPVDIPEDVGEGIIPEPPPEPHKKPKPKRKQRSLNTKFVRYCTDTVTTPNTPDSAWWEGVPAKEVSGGIYVELYRYCLQRNSGLKRTRAPVVESLPPGSARTLVQYMQNGEGAISKGKASGGLLGIRTASCDTKILNSPKFISIWDHIRYAFKSDVGAGLVDTELLVFMGLLHDGSGHGDSVYATRYGGTSIPIRWMRLYKIFTLDEFADNVIGYWINLIDKLQPVARDTLLKEVETRDIKTTNKATITDAERRRIVTVQWFKIMRSLVVDYEEFGNTVVYYASASRTLNAVTATYSRRITKKVDAVTSVQRHTVPLYDMSGCTGKLTEWVSKLVSELATGRLTEEDAAASGLDVDTWIRPKAISTDLTVLSELKPPQNEVERGLTSVCTAFPMIALALDLPWLWRRAKLPSSKYNAHLPNGALRNLGDLIETTMLADEMFRKYIASDADATYAKMRTDGV